jgi:hypothetical protein
MRPCRKTRRLSQRLLLGTQRAGVRMFAVEEKVLPSGVAALKPQRPFPQQNAGSALDGCASTVEARPSKLGNRQPNEGMRGCTRAEFKSLIAYSTGNRQGGL